MIVADNQRATTSHPPSKKFKGNQDDPSEGNVPTELGKPSSLHGESSAPTGEEKEHPAGRYGGLDEFDDLGESESEPEPEPDHFRARDLPKEKIFGLLLSEKKWDVRLAAINDMIKDGFVGENATDFVNEAVQRSNHAAREGDDNRTVREAMTTLINDQLARVKKAPDPVPNDEIFTDLTHKRAVDVKQGAVDAVTDDAIGTYGMGPCVAVGITCEHGGKRYSALAHWDGTEPTGSPRDLFDDLNTEILQQISGNAVGSTQLENVRYLVVGGRLESAYNQANLLNEILARDLTVSIHLVTPNYRENEASGPNAETAESAALITKDGVFNYDVTTEL